MSSQLALKSRIGSTQSLSKMFRAQEMIASAHIAKAREAAFNAKPYSDTISETMVSLVSHVHDVDHPIFRKEKNNNHVAAFAITADRGMAGAYTSNVIRQTENLLARLDEQGKIPQLYVFGRRGASHYRYRSRDMEKSWEGDSDHPSVEAAREISSALLDAYMRPKEEGGVSELYIVYTEFINLVSQKVRVLRMLPIELVNDGSAPGSLMANAASLEPQQPSINPLYTFEPTADAVLDTVLPRYVMSRIYECLLTSAASETASRQNAMHAATENAGKLIKDLTRRLNAARQAQITQELTEIISSADALKKNKK